MGDFPDLWLWVGHALKENVLQYVCHDLKCPQSTYVLP